MDAPRASLNLPAVVTDNLPMSAEQVRDQVNTVQKIMEAVMKEGEHYGRVPGSKKPSLWKSGAEKLCFAFHIATSFQVEDLSTADYYRYRVRCVGTHQSTGTKLGEGMGAASSNEEKYKWRRVICQEEFDGTPEGRRRIKYSKDQNGRVYAVKQIRAEPDDIDNTILQMACKRAHVSMTRGVTAVSDIFNQDIEDLPEHLRDAEDDTPPPAVPGPKSKKEPAVAQAAPQGPVSHSTEEPVTAAVKSTPETKKSDVENGDKPLTDGQVRVVKAKMLAATLSDADFEKRFNCKLEVGAALSINRILSWVRSPTEI